MKKLSIFIFILLIFNTISKSQVFPVTTILDNGNANNRVKMVFMSDGYTAGQLVNFNTNVTDFKNNILGQSPYSNYAKLFNFYAIQVPSVQTGANHPGNASDENTSGNQPITTANNYFGGTFDYASIHRLVVCTNSTAINGVLADNFPSYNQAFLFVNSPYYGGSGGANAVATLNTSSSEVAIHEIGHSFSNLADEYAIGGQGEKANRTTTTDVNTVRWKSWLGINGVGIYPIGVEGWQRPHQNCKMQFLGVSFCAVCTEATIDKIYSLVTPIDGTVPAGSSATVTGPTNFSASLILPNPNTISAVWKLNGVTVPSGFVNGRVAAGSTSATITPAQLSAGANTLVVYVTDATPLSKTFLPNSGYVFTKTWTINSALPVELVDFQVNKKEKSILVNWTTNSEKQVDHFEIERGFDAKAFGKIGEVKAKGNSTEKLSYDFIDNQLFNNATYYRLKMVDADGNYKYSPIRAIDKTDKFTYKIYPNPFQNQLKITGLIETAEVSSIEIVNEIGLKMASHNLTSTNGNYEHVFETGSFAPGIYFVTIRFSDGYEIKEKVVKGAN